MITCEEPEVTLSGRYTAIEASKKLGIHRNTLRVYTEKGLIKCVKLKRRVYYGRDILKFWRNYYKNNKKGSVV